MIAPLTQACEVVFADLCLALGSLTVGPSRCLDQSVRSVFRGTGTSAHIAIQLSQRVPFSSQCPASSPLSVPLFWAVFS